MKSLSRLAEECKSLAEPLVEAREDDLFMVDVGAQQPSASHSIRVMRPKGGKGPRWYSKGSGGDDLQLVNEYLSWLIYRTFGLGVAPGAMLVTDSRGNIRITTSQVPGRQVTKPDTELSKSDFKRGLFVDAMLGNWDVVGNEPRFNVFVDDEGRASRIDTGGMDFRALGARKGEMFGPEVTELGTFAGMRGGTPMAGSAAARIFSRMNDAEFRRAAKLFVKTPWSRVDAAFRKAQADVDELENRGLSTQTRKYIAKVKPIMKARYEDVMGLINSMGLV